MSTSFSSPSLSPDDWADALLASAPQGRSIGESQGGRIRAVGSLAQAQGGWIARFSPSLRRQLWVLGGCILFLMSIYGVFTMLRDRSQWLSVQIVEMQKNIHLQERDMRQVKALAEALGHLLIPEKQKNLFVEVGFLQRLAKSCGIEDASPIVMPTTTVYHDGTIKIMKNTVHISFLMRNDRCFWAFLRAMQRHVPGVVWIDFLAMEKIRVRQNQEVWIKGRYHFQWYTFCSCDPS